MDGINESVERVKHDHSQLENYRAAAPEKASFP